MHAAICHGHEHPMCLHVQGLSETTIMATMYQKPGDYDQPWDPDVHFVASNDFFKTFSTHVRCGNMFEIIGSTIYLAFANSCPTDINGKDRGRDSYPGGITLYTSTDGGANFIQACLPVALKVWAGAHLPILPTHCTHTAPA